VGPDLLIGLSTHDAEQAASAHEQGADYIGVGPVFPTPSKEYHDGIGLDMVSRLCNATDLPTVAIGGITADNASQARSAGATAVAAIRALCGVDDPQAAARSFDAENEERHSE
jgi:thiamine-phosphate pyrophosphorylase